METPHLVGARVLVGEHEELTRVWLDEQLRECGADVIAVERGEDLLCALVEQGPFDAVICDQEITDPPSTDVLALTRGAGLDLPFIVLAPSGVAGHASAHDHVTFLPRSCDPHTLVTELDHAVSSHGVDLSKCVFIACAACGRGHIAELWPPMPSLCAHCHGREDFEERWEDLGDGD